MSMERTVCRRLGRRGLVLGSSLALVMYIALATSGAIAGESKEMGEEASITKVLDASAAAWSRGDLDAFMTCYENDPRTIYIGHGAVIHGYAAIHDIYASRFGAAAASGLGKLSMEVLEVRPLGPEYTVVTGRYHLARQAQPEASGIFTLIFHKSEVGWRIISDHTS